jgi:quercetin dioxygenase-like cupin family protein
MLLECVGAACARLTRATVVAGLALTLAVTASTLAAQAATQDTIRARGERAPLFQQVVPGLLARTRFVADSAAGMTVELWDLLIGPGMQSDSTSFPGSVVLEVRAGSGRVTIGGQAQELRPGSFVRVPAGVAVAFTNTRDDLGLALRATVVRGAPR